MQLLLLEPLESPYSARIAHAARVAGLLSQHLASIESVPADAALIGVGPSFSDPLQVARALQRAGSQALLVFFASSGSARAALHAELIRDPIVYPRCELIELPETARELATRMGRVVAHVRRQSPVLRSAAGRARRRARGIARGTRAPVTDEPYLANILAQANDAIFSTDELRRVRTWNKACEHLFGVSAEGAIGQPLDFLTAAGEGTEPLAEVAERVFASSESEQVQIICRAGDGTAVNAAISVAPMRDDDGTLLGLSVIARDQSEYQRVEEALRNANRQKDEFLAIMSHELRTPLTSILGYTDMLLRGLSGPLAPLTSRYVGNVRSAGDRLLELVNGLLDYTRLEAGVERLDVRPVDLAALVDQVVQHCQHQAQIKRIVLRLVVGTGVATRVEADEDKLIRILRSILVNALKFTPENGWISVHVGPDPESRDAVRVSVSDSGIGIRDELLPRVWERFYQGDVSLTRPYGGMGLGLSIARQLVALHRGRVGAASGGPGLGSTFWFSLPLRQEQA
jgi:PAS domain S-box-containing protein